MVDQDNLPSYELEHTELFEVKSDIESVDKRDAESDIERIAAKEIESDAVRDVEDDAKDSTNLLQENKPLNYLCAIHDTSNPVEQQMNILDQRLMYDHLYRAYKVALQKALKAKSKSQHLIKILQEFAKNDETSEKFDKDDSSSDKENSGNSLQNPKKRRNRGRPLKMKHLKALHENQNSDKPKRRCKKYSNLEHYQKNCNT
ncbi:17786_t:CDS:2 [Dentiscutata erythropus]|uniref:17786_t:CDS:1 n=1 Tax=Dentiscutata erythropus TaxID=1348616 RepID=A0A9N9ENV2_9GLOM|nr:17786_t:CDS:2 [Dentiscutata erythropus]